MYSVGTVCIGQGHKTYPELNGLECEIIGDLRIRGGINPSGSLAYCLVYDVRWADGREMYVAPINLRPKHIPGSWDELEKIWRPGETV